MTHRLTFTVASLLALCAGTARAAALSATLTGAGLTIDSPCATSVAITPDPSLHGQTVIQATAEHQEEIDHLWLESRGAVRIGTHPGRCWGEINDSQSTLVLTIRVPEATALSVEEAGASHYSVGALDGTLALDASGALTLDDASATSVQADISGHGTLRLARIDGPATIGVSGHGDIAIGQATMATFEVDLSGAGEVRVEHGHIGRARLESSGAGSMQIGADVDDAHVEISGVGSVHFARVNGRLTKEISGAGSVTVQ